MTEDINKRVAQFVQVRDAIKRIEERHKTELAPLKADLNILEGKLEAALSANNAESLKTVSGTCYASVRHTASLADPDAFMNYVITHQKFDLLDRRANATAVRDYVKETNELPPGVNLNSVRTIGVRRAPGS